MTKVMISTIGELVKQGRIRRGDFIDYKPDSATYETNPENTGYESQSLKICEKVNWRVVYIDKTSGEVWILPDNNLVEDVYLSGIIGYMNGPKELNTIASKLGSNSKLGVIARCPTIEDINKIEDYTSMKQKVRRYAFYPDHFKAYGFKMFNGNIYKRIQCFSNNARFYTSDGGGREETDENGFKYRVPKRGKPVLVSETWYNHEFKNLILYGKPFWLSSTCVILDSIYGDFYVRYADINGVYAHYLYSSACIARSKSYGVRPLVSLSSILEIDTINESMGSSPEKAWRFAK